MPPKSKAKAGGKALAATKPSVAAKATVAANTRGGKSTTGGRGKQSVKGGGFRVRGGLSKLGARGGGPKDVPGTTSNTSSGVPSTERRRLVEGGVSPSVPGLTGVGSGGGSPIVDAGLTNAEPGGGIPLVPGLTGGRNFEIEGTSAQRRTLSASSERTASGSVSRTNRPAQYPPTRQQPSGHQRQSLNLNDLPVSRVEVPVHRQGNLRAVDMVEEEQQEEEDYYAEFAEQDPPSEKEDEVDAPFVDAQVIDGNQNEAPQQDLHYAQHLEYLLGLPGRENLLRLSPIPIPNIQTIWFDRDNGVLAKVICNIMRRKFDGPWSTCLIRRGFSADTHEQRWNIVVCKSNQVAEAYEKELAEAVFNADASVTDHRGSTFELGELPRLQGKRKRQESYASSSTPDLSEMQEKLDAAQHQLEAQEAANARWDEEQRRRDEEQCRRDEEQRMRDEEHRKGQEQLAEMTKLLTYLKKSDSRIGAFMDDEHATTEDPPAATPTTAPTQL
ncbi:hypothetical protein AALP_AA6G185100 [Arabis alpina]|uniref:Uncharacterized protein n=1 Tax=Arabis alpina TaxID=50452 RepID=A0A087GQ32_ARAAL|nr:hypothetical protein AALP_AA6G185100 [Arabis alpina]